MIWILLHIFIMWILDLAVIVFIPPGLFISLFVLHKFLSISALTAEKLKGWVGGVIFTFTELLAWIPYVSHPLFISLFNPQSFFNLCANCRKTEGMGRWRDDCIYGITHANTWLIPHPLDFAFSTPQIYVKWFVDSKNTKGTGRWGNNSICIITDLLKWILDSVARIAKELKGWVGCGVTDVNTWISGLLVPPPQPIDFTFLYSTNSYQVVRRERKMKGRVGGKIISFVVADLLTWRLDTAVFGYPHPTPLSWFFSTILRKFLSISARRTKNWRDGSVGK